MKKSSKKKSELKPELLCRAHIYYEGRVQGVGFRYTAERLALEKGLGGWVKNLPDGRVEVVCEGSKDRIEAFLGDIAGGDLGATIRKATCCWEPPTRGFQDFCVEYCL